MIDDWWTYGKQTLQEKVNAADVLIVKAEKNTAYILKIILI